LACDRRAVFFMCDRRAVDGAIGGHGSLQREILDFGGVSRKRGALLNKRSIPER
jgi:hypothetical protein